MASLPVYTTRGCEEQLFNLRKVVRIIPDAAGSRMYLDDGTDVLLTKDIRKISNIINGWSEIGQ